MTERIASENAPCTAPGEAPGPGTTRHAIGSNRKTLLLLGIAHVFNDFNIAAPAVLLPFFVSERHFSYAAASGLAFALGLSSSLTQPLVGVMADRRPIMWTLPVGLVTGSAGIALSGVAPTYPLVFLCIAIAGLGVAAFHPEAARLASHLAGERRGEGMSLFSVGGNLGLTVCPMLLTPFLMAFGLRGSLFAFVPAAVIASVLVLQMNNLEAVRARTVRRTASAGSGSDMWGAFGRLTALLVLRSVVTNGFSTFIPLYVTRVLHGSEAAAGAGLTVLMASGAFGTLLGGPCSDRYGRGIVVQATLATLGPLAAAFLAQANMIAAIAVLVPLGIFLYAPFSVMVVMGQEYLPNHEGLASGITLGISMSFGGMAAPLFGWLADTYGLRIALAAIGGLAVLAAGLALTLPTRRTVPASAASPSR